MSTLPGRVFGLDVMRATAILLVVFWHCIDALGWFVPVRGLPPYIDGVDLFFVLSGYLIGGILLRYVDMRGVPWWRRLLDFWQRRWLRTLPTYYLLLVVNIVLLYLGITNGLLNNNALAYFVFLQNLWTQLDLFFWESWSLSVEEWSYLAFPLVLAAGELVRVRSAKGWYLFAVVLFLVLPLVVRFAMLPGTDTTYALEQGARKLVPARLDTIGFGLLAALLAQQASRSWSALRWPLFLIGIAGIGINAHLYGSERLSYSATWFFTVNAVVMCCLLPLLSTWYRRPRAGGIVVFISAVSYPLYMVHQPVRAIWNRLFANASTAEGVALWAAYWIVCIALAWLVHRYWETRFMKMRDRIGARVLGRVTPSS